MCAARVHKVAIMAINNPTNMPPITEVRNLQIPNHKILYHGSPDSELNPLNRLNKTIATPSFKVDSPNAKLNKVSLTPSCSIIAMTATGSTAANSAASVKRSPELRLLLNGVTKKRTPVITADISVPTIAYVTISTILSKNAALFKKYVASNIISGTNKFR